MFRKLFIDHPAAVGETYAEHFVAALTYAGPLLLAGLAATLHAVVPGLFQKTGSRTIVHLHQRLHSGHGRGAVMDVEYVI